MAEPMVKAARGGKLSTERRAAVKIASTEALNTIASWTVACLASYKHVGHQQTTLGGLHPSIAPWNLGRSTATHLVHAADALTLAPKALHPLGPARLHAPGEPAWQVRVSSLSSLGASLSPQAGGHLT